MGSRIEKIYHRINEDITASEVRVTYEDNSQIMNKVEALTLAKSQGLDLIEISGSSTPPVCIIGSYEKFKYQQMKHKKEIKKRQKVIEVKEIYLRPITDVNDLNRKIEDAKRFIVEDNDKVRIAVKVRGRDKKKPQLAMDMIQKVKNMINVFAKIDEDVPESPGFNQYVILISKK